MIIRRFYVACEKDKIVGCGAIGPYWGKERDEYFLRVKSRHL